MLCQICGKRPASVHFTEIHDNKMSEIHVCERCAEDKGIHAVARSSTSSRSRKCSPGMVDSMTQIGGGARRPRPVPDAAGSLYFGIQGDRPARLCRVLHGVPVPAAPAAAPHPRRHAAPRQVARPRRRGASRARARSNGSTTSCSARSSGRSSSAPPQLRDEISPMKLRAPPARRRRSQEREATPPRTSGPAPERRAHG